MSTTQFTRKVTYYGEEIGMTEEHYSFLMQCVSNGETIEQAMDRVRIEFDEGIPIEEAGLAAAKNPNPNKLDYYIYLYNDH